jgi:hypothetical protein
MSKPVAWSYSALTSFETCPRRYYLTKISKQVVEPPTEATMWGNSVHKALETRITQNKSLPPSMQQWEPVVAKVLSKGGKVEAEQKIALDRNLKQVTYFAPTVWVRGVTDFTIAKDDKVFIGDWKTGKPTPESAQLKLTAAMTMAVKPWVNYVINAFIWLKDGSTTVEKFTRDDIPTIWQEFAPRVQRLEHAVAEQKFPPRPSGLCRKWCPVGKTLCEYCGE